MKVVAGLFLVVVLFSSFQIVNNLSGTWEYAGDLANGKKESAPTEYSLQRKYTGTNYEAFVIEKGYQPQKYETGNYSLKTDSCLETQTWCGQPSNLLNVTIHYHCRMAKDTMVLTGILPNGTSVEEYWKKVK
jgi:predicted secreted protein